MKSETPSVAELPENELTKITDIIDLPVSLADIHQAREVIQKEIYSSPMLYSRTFGEVCGAEVYLKAENLQRSGSFKIRGALYKVSRLTPEERSRGVITASAGNHAQGVAIAATKYGCKSTIIMPVGAPISKVAATQSYGAEVILNGNTYDDAYHYCLELQKETGAVYIPAFDDLDIITGQGTLGLEILEEVPDVDAVIVPIGGGGLISGIAIAIKSLRPEVQIIGVEPKGAASSRLSLDRNEVSTLDDLSTIADGIAVKRPGKHTFPIIQQLVDEVVTVDDETIIQSVLLLMERGKLLVEGAGAASAAVLLDNSIDLKGKKVVAVLSGGNIDINLVSRFIQHGLSSSGRYLVFHTLLPDKPGELLRLCNVIADQGINIIDVDLRRNGMRIPIRQTEVFLTIETRNKEHCQHLMNLLGNQGYIVDEVEAGIRG